MIRLNTTTDDKFMIVYIYSLNDPRNNSAVRYVGKTVKSLETRLKGHVKNAKWGERSHKNNWIRSLLAAGIYPEIKLLCTANEHNWQDQERNMISFYRTTGILTNGTDGGDGVSDSSGEIGKKISKALTGIKRSVETRAKISMANALRGPDVAIKISEAKRGKPLSQEHRKKLMGHQAWNKGKKLSIEHCQKLSAAHKGKPSSFAGKKHTDESRALISKTQIGRKASDITRAKMSFSTKKYWENYHAAAQ